MTERSDPASEQKNAANHRRRKRSGQQNARPHPPLEQQSHHAERYPVTHKRGRKNARPPRIATPEPEADQQAGQKVLEELEQRRAANEIDVPGLSPSMAINGMLARSVQGLLSLQRRRGLLERLEQLQVLLAEQVQSLPHGNESWLDTERELMAVEQALERIPAIEA